MTRKTFILIILSFFLTNCSNERSANNKMSDLKGLKGEKRFPLYNKKYIAQAKKNIMRNNYDEDQFIDDELYENENVELQNIEMYKAMIHEESQQKRENDDNASPSCNECSHSIAKANHKINTHTDYIKPIDLELREEINNIKSMLNEARQELALYKSENQSLKKEKQHQENKLKDKQQIESTITKTSYTKSSVKNKEYTNPTQQNNNSVIIEPVKSI